MATHGQTAEHKERPPGVSDRLYNHELYPGKRDWGWYEVFAMWMADVHSVGGYLFAASLFTLGLAGWQVLICLVIGIVIVMYLVNWVAAPGVQLGVPYPVVCRVSMGVFGANIAAIIRALIAVAWYGIQTFVASKALIVVTLKFFPEYAIYLKTDFLGLSYLGWVAFLLMWGAQFLVFYRGMGAITKFIDWAGPGVYLVMFSLAIWIVWKAGWSNINFTLGDIKYTGMEVILQMITATALVVSYFSGPMVNFSDFSRFATNMKDVKKGNWWGLPVNFLAFAIVTVITTSGTATVFGQMISDPVEVVARIDSTTAVVIGALTFIIATIGINIVANFVSPAYDLVNVFPKHITFITGGMITAFAAVFIMPWQLFSAPKVIHFTLDTLGCFIGPLYGILVSDFFLVKKQQVYFEDLWHEKPTGRYWYKNGFNPAAIKALILGMVLAALFVFIPPLNKLADFSWGIGAAVAAALYVRLMKTQRLPSPGTEAAAKSTT